MRYRPEIDGLRSFAVLPVILFHAGIPGFSGGFVGVDVFFVISGYLITGILAREMDGGTYSLMRFYERRARRILPALLVMLVVATAMAWFILPPPEMQWFGQSVLATALFVANFYFLFRGQDYFAGQTAEYPLLHTWSLAVEEQFYIFFPLLLRLVWKRGVRQVLMLIVGLSVLSLIGAEILSRINQGVNFYLLPSRIWELGAGSICALVHFRAPRQQNHILAAVGLVLIIGSVVVLREGVPFPSLYAVPPVLGTALILLYAGSLNHTGRLLSWAPLVAIGTASYSAYLWHQPFFSFAHVWVNGDPGMAVMLGLSVLSVALGFVSLHLVEAPFRRRGGVSSTRVVVISAAALSCFIALGVALHLSLGAAGRPAAAHLPRDYYSTLAKPNSPIWGGGARSCENFCTVVAQTAPAQRVLLAGDSHAQDLIAGMTELAKERNWELVLFINKGCSYTRISNGKSGCAEAAQRLAEGADQSFDQVLLLNRFSGLTEEIRPEGLAGAMDDYVALVTSFLDQGSTVTLFAPRLMIDRDPVRAALQDQIDDIRVAAQFSTSRDWQSVRARLEGVTGLILIDQDDVLLAQDCGQTACFRAHTPDRHPLYRDPHHVSPYAAARLITAYTTRIDRISGHVKDTDDTTGASTLIAQP